MMKTPNLVLIALLISVVNLSAQIPQFDWINSLSTPGSGPEEVDAFPADMVVDADGNSYHAGNYIRDILFSNGQTLLLGDFDVAAYVLKRDANGNMLWAKSIQPTEAGISGLDYAIKIAVDNEGNVYVSGALADTGIKIDGLTLPGTSCINDCNGLFLMKLDQNGVPQWAKPILGDNLTDHSLGGLTSDGSGNIYMAGNYQGATLDFFGGNTVYQNLPGNGFFMAKFNNQGAVDWVRFLEDSSEGEAYNVQIEYTNNLLAVYGYYYDGLLEFGNNVQIDTFSQGDYFIAVFQASDGNALWVENLHSSDYIDILDIDVDASGRVYLAIDWSVDLKNGSEEISFTNADYAATLVRMSPDNIEIPVKIDSYDDSYPISAVTLDAQGNIFAGGYYGSTSSTIIDTTVTNAGGFDALLFAIDASLDLKWARSIGGPNDQGIVNYAYGGILGTDAQGNLYVEGAFIAGMTADGITLSNDGLFSGKINSGSVSLQEPLVYGGFNIFPNPTSGAFNLQFDEALASEVQMVLIDQQGREVHRQNLNGDKLVVNAGLLPGMYTVKVMSDRGVMVQKLMVAK
ncbi:MAG: T9SS type A sorting domain-containing protein [Saprospiraceae bacterium]|nr:T9SS type A sorting domain-containing protein [Saprospiraceae bacterium]